MSSYNNLVCPHCGHDGTPETARPPLGSCGFNYLADDVVCREVRGHDEGGRLLLSSDFKCQGSRGTNPRLECRSCWQTFPVPEGVLWDVSAEQPPETPAPAETLQGQAAAEAGDSVADAASDITRNLAILIRSALEEVDRGRAGRIADMEAGIASLARITEGIAPVREDLAALLPQVASMGEVQPLLHTRLAALETAVGAQAENQSEHAGQLRSLSAIQEDVYRKLDDQAKTIADLGEQGRQWQQSLQAHLDAVNERAENLGRRLRAEAASQISGACTELQQGQEELQKRLDTQAEAIRALHSVAQNRVARREDLQAAVQKLEEIAGALDQVNPLPKEL